MDKYILVYTLIKKLYSNGLRDIIVSAIDDPDTEWDDTMLAVLDSIFKKTD